MDSMVLLFAQFTSTKARNRCFARMIYYDDE